MTDDTMTILQSSSMCRGAFGCKTRVLMEPTCMLLKAGAHSVSNLLDDG